eukprot:COSAG01_NODE_20913_length_928_cov_1.103739_2_plen_129_part_01
MHASNYRIMVQLTTLLSSAWPITYTRWRNAPSGGGSATGAGASSPKVDAATEARIVKLEQSVQSLIQANKQILETMQLISQQGPVIPPSQSAPPPSAGSPSLVDPQLIIGLQRRLDNQSHILGALETKV